jgi:hypothetical protein
MCSNATKIGCKDVCVSFFIARCIGARHTKSPYLSRASRVRYERPKVHDRVILSRSTRQRSSDFFYWIEVGSYRTSFRPPPANDVSASDWSCRSRWPPGENHQIAAYCAARERPHTHLNGTMHEGRSNLHPGLPNSTAAHAKITRRSAELGMSPTNWLEFQAPNSVMPSAA